MERLSWQAIEILENAYPHLIIKKRVARESLRWKFLKRTNKGMDRVYLENIYKRRFEWYNRISALNKRGV